MTGAVLNTYLPRSRWKSSAPLLTRGTNCLDQETDLKTPRNTKFEGNDC